MPELGVTKPYALPQLVFKPDSPASYLDPKNVATGGLSAAQATLGIAESLKDLPATLLKTYETAKQTSQNSRNQSLIQRRIDGGDLSGISVDSSGAAKYEAPKPLTDFDVQLNNAKLDREKAQTRNTEAGIKLKGAQMQQIQSTPAKEVEGKRDWIKKYRPLPQPTGGSPNPDVIPAPGAIPTATATTPEQAASLASFNQEAARTIDALENPGRGDVMDANLSAYSAANNANPSKDFAAPALPVQDETDINGAINSDSKKQPQPEILDGQYFDEKTNTVLWYDKGTLVRKAFPNPDGSAPSQWQEMEPKANPGVVFESVTDATAWMNKNKVRAKIEFNAQGKPFVREAEPIEEEEDGTVRLTPAQAERKASSMSKNYKTLPSTVMLFGSGQMPGLDTVKMKLDSLLARVNGDFSQLDPQEQQTYVKQVVKANDLNSAVLLGEMRVTSDSVGLVDKFKLLLNKWKDGDSITPEQARQIHQLINTLHSAAKEKHISDLPGFFRDAKKYGLEPQVIGIPSDAEGWFRKKNGDTGGGDFDSKGSRIPEDIATLNAAGNEAAKRLDAATSRNNPEQIRAAQSEIDAIRNKKKQVLATDAATRAQQAVSDIATRYNSGEFDQDKEAKEKAEAAMRKYKKQFTPR